jgi:CubicO group peptidase (beta-lactamase class C family)
MEDFSMNRNFKPASWVMLTFVILGFLAVQPGGFSQEKQDKPRRIDELITMYHNYRLFNGSVLVAENGQVIYKKGVGLANMEWNIPNEPDTKFRLGSITKQFTAMLALQLVEKGKLKLDGKISDYLPEYRKDTGQQVTIHQLLNHTSGIPSYTGLPGFFADVSRDPYTVDEFIKKYCSGDLEFQPGSKFAYNNSGYFLLGAIIEKATGKTYEEVLKEQILDPLGMNNTGYDRHDVVMEKRAAGYEKRPRGFVNAPYLDMALPYAAGAMYSTVEDLYLWDQALYADRLLSKELKDVMFKPGLENYAYGWVVVDVPVGQTTKRRIFHGGGINGFNTLLVRLVDDKHLIVLLNNTGGTKLNDMARGITNILYGLPAEKPRKSIAETLLQTISDQGIEAALKQYRDLKRQQPDEYDWSEPELNILGYQLLGMNKVKEAIEVFKLNVEVYPQASNTYDSLGEAYLKNGEKELAIKNYAKSLELNPKNTHAIDMLKKISEK